MTLIIGVGLLLIISGLVVAATPGETKCANCGGQGKADCTFCSNGANDCTNPYCESGYYECVFCVDGKADCWSCVNGTCFLCYGAGGEDCRTCNGAGVNLYMNPPMTCLACSGTGWFECTVCSGTGNCTTCQGRGWNTCLECNGTGRVECPECGGNGSLVCAYCAGQGWNTCANCNGKGSQTVVGAFLIPGGIMVLVGILLMPTALIVGRNHKNLQPMIREEVRLGKIRFTKRMIVVAVIIALLASGAGAAWFSTPQNAETQGEKEFDSGWIDITDKRGQNFTITHNLNSTNVQTDINGRVEANGSIHQRNLGFPGFSRTLGGDSGLSVVQTSDGGFAVAGTVNSAALTNVLYLVRTDGNGIMKWNRTVEGTGNIGYSGGYSMIQTSDGGYAITGTIAFSLVSGGDVLLVKTDANGNVQWNRTYEGLGIREDGRWVLQTADGGYTIACETAAPGGLSARGHSLLLIKTDASGNFLWQKTWGVEHPCSVVQTADGGYGLLGLNFTDYTRSLLAKTDAAGNIQWEKTLWQPPIVSSAYEPVVIHNYAKSLVQTVDGGYAIAGYADTATLQQPSRYYTDSYKFLLVKTDANGGILWEKTYGGTGDMAVSLVQTADEGYAILGNANCDKTPRTELLDLVLVKTDAGGNLQWRKTFGGTSEDYASAVIQTSDGAYVVVGSTGSYGDMEAFLVKTDGEGELGLAMINSTPNALTLYRGRDDVDWNYVRVRVWKND